jgi:glycosyltransferase involved in cell wall biosynthesis
MHKLSIITVNLNNSPGLQKTLESVESQTFKDFELIIIDGDSNDGSVELIKEFESKLHTSISQHPFHSNHLIAPDFRLHWLSEPDSGIYNAMNKGIDKATGKYLLFLNSGDWLNKDILKEINWDQSTEDIVYCNMHRYYSEERIEEQYYPNKLTLKLFINSNIGHQASFIKKDLLVSLGSYNENYTLHADYDFWINAIIKHNCSVKHLPIFLTFYNMHGFSSFPSAKSQQERDAILLKFIPQRIIDDYSNWIQKDKTHVVTDWYYNHWTYFLLVFYYKITKNLRKFFGKEL